MGQLPPHLRDGSSNDFPGMCAPSHAHHRTLCCGRPTNHGGRCSPSAAGLCMWLRRRRHDGTVGGVRVPLCWHRDARDAAGHCVCLRWHGNARSSHAAVNVVAAAAAPAAAPAAPAVASVAAVADAAAVATTADACAAGTRPHFARRSITPAVFLRKLFRLGGDGWTGASPLSGARPHPHV